MRDVIYDRIRISPDSKPVFQQKATDFMSLTAAAIFALVLPFPEKSLNLASRRIRRDQIGQINVSCIPQLYRWEFGQS